MKKVQPSIFAGCRRGRSPPQKQPTKTQQQHNPKPKRSTYLLGGMDSEPQLRGAKAAGHRDEQDKTVDDLLQRAMAAEEAARKASEDAEKVLLEVSSSQERHRLRGALGRDDGEAHPLRGARPSGTEVSEATHSLVAWWETFVPALTNSLATAFLPPPTMIAAATGTSTPKSASKRRQKPRRLYPSGMVSLVPDDYVPPPPVHDEVWDGVTQDGRRLHVKSFWRHFACYQDTIFNDGAVKVLEQLGRYRSPVWYSPLLASAAPIMVEHELQYTRETIDDGEGGCVTLDWAFPEGETIESSVEQSYPTVILFPGLAGHSQKDYIRSMCNVVTCNLGWRVCVLNWRGFNDAPISKSKVFRPDDISDMQMSITFAHKRYLKSPLFAVGFSAGSNQLVKYLGMHGNDQPVKAAISVCNGFEYEKHLKRIENTTLGHDVYSRGMTYLHQEYLRTHKDELEKIDGFDLQKALAATKHSELDEALVCSLYGYSDVGEYYRAIDSRPYIKDVTVPLLCVQSSDDPLFTEGGVLTRDVLPVEDIHDNEKAIYFETELGSHLSFVEAEIPGGVTRHEHTFIDRVVEAYLMYADVKVKVHEY